MRSTFLLLFLFFTSSIWAQSKINNSEPKLIVSVVVDQMRYDYLSKYYNKFVGNGFKKLMNDGFNCKNTNYNYAPTYTGPGHASIFTGTSPAFHGIIGNNWFVRGTKKSTYVTEDKSVETVGSSTKKAGRMSPRNLISSTFGDEIRLHSNMRSRSFAISLKDRGAILPGGHLSNGTFWFDTESGNFITSSFYMKSLPKWLVDFNELRLADKYLSQDWNTLLPIAEYTESAADDNPYEGLFKNETKPIFPHKLPNMFSKSDYDVIRSTPFGTSITKDLTLEILKSENIGKGEFTDFLSISFSSTDYCGHLFGPQSIELEDIYLRLDKDLAEILTYLDKNYGKENYLFFLTADHACAYNPKYLMDMKMNAGYFDYIQYTDSLKKYIQINYGDSNLVTNISNDQVYIDLVKLKDKKINQNSIEEDIAAFSLGFKGIANAYTSQQLNGAILKNKSGELIQNGFYIKRSGNIALLQEPAWLDNYQLTGSSHGTTYPYDTHVPLLWYGWNIKAGSNSEPINITDIAPTISSFMNTMPPNACTGKPILFLTK